MRKSSILIVDDAPINIKLLVEVLKPIYELRIATSGKQALEQLKKSYNEIDLILLDVNMPEMSGIEVLEQVNEHPDWIDIPVIFVTALDQECDEAEGLQKGAVDYITKPISAPIVRARVKTQLTLCNARKELSHQNQILEEKVKERTEEISSTQAVIINALTCLALKRDKETGNHIIRTAEYVKILGTLLRSLPEYCDELDDEAIDSMFRTAPLHDVGKVGIPDHVLLKPGKLTDEEWVIMRQHPTIGGDALRDACDGIHKSSSRFLLYAQQIAYSHHEKWDGSGYPEKLSGSDIPLAARLMAVADVYDALMSKRCYKDAMSHEQTRSIMLEGKGTHFDPTMLQVFLDNEHLFLEIADKYKDE